MLMRRATELLMRQEDIRDITLMDSLPWLQLKASIYRQGCLNPIVINRKGVVLIGHYRLWAAIAVDCEMVPVEVVDKIDQVKVVTK